MHTSATTSFMELKILDTISCQRHIMNEGACQQQMSRVLYVGDTYQPEAGGGSSWLLGRVPLQLAWRQQLQAS